MEVASKVMSALDVSELWKLAADVLEEHRESLASQVSELCYTELDSYRDGNMPREESVGTVRRLVGFLCKNLLAMREGEVSRVAQSLHEEMVQFEEGIAARRVRVAIQFQDLLRGLQFMRREVWNLLRRELGQKLVADEVFELEQKINQVFDEFFIGLAGSYLKSQSDLIATHESALKKWEEVVKSASHITLKIPCREEFAKIVRLQAEAIARRVLFDNEAIYDIITAVGEVCDNAIEHGKSEMGIDVQYFMTATDFKVEVRDYGPGFDATGKGLEAPDVFSERGRGIFLMRHLMDEVTIESVPGQGTRVVMSKRRK